jgi:pimeloyl-ACP methyl ester carboxylesterase
MSSEEGAELHLVGHDIGSLMVQMAAKMQPALFESVTLIGEPEYRVILEQNDGSRYSVQNAR